MTTSISVVSFGMDISEEGVDNVSSVAVEDSFYLVDAIDFTNSNCLFSVSVCCSKILSRVLRLVACVACVVIKLEIRAFDS